MTNVLLLLSVLGLVQPAVEAQPLSGETVQGTIVELNAQTVTLQTATGRVTLELGKLAGLSVTSGSAAPAVAAKPSVWVELIDGSTLSGSSYTASGGKAKIGPLAEGQPAWEIPTQDIRWIRFQAQNEAVAAQWNKILESDVKTDLLVTRKDDVLDYHKGAVRNVNDQAVEFDLDGEVLPVKRAKVQGIVLHHPAGRQLPEVVCSVAEVSGAVWPAQSVVLSGEKLEWTTPTGLKVIRPATAVARLDFSRGKILYVSDLKPESVQWTPYFSLGKELPVRREFYAPRHDRSLTGGPLEVEGKTYKKGLAVHSRTTIVYRLPDRFSRFTATAGIDDRVRPRGHVQLVIRGDDRVLLDTTVAGTEPAKPIALDVAGVRRLSILVDFGNDLDIADHLDLCDAKFVK